MKINIITIYLIKISLVLILSNVNSKSTEKESEGLTMLNMNSLTSHLKSRESVKFETVFQNSKKKHKKKKLKTRSSKINQNEIKTRSVQDNVRTVPTPADPLPNNTFVNSSSYKRLNDTFVKMESNSFVINHRKWDFKMTDRFLEDIYRDMNFRDEKAHTMKGYRPFMEIFHKEYSKCDTDSNNVLNFAEFEACMKSQSYLAQIIKPDDLSIAAISNYTWTNQTGYYDILFKILDTHEQNFFTFHSYMTLRLMMFSWRKCSVMAPFIEETAFECAMEIASGWKTASRTTMRNVFFMSLELSNSERIRNLDFVTYVMIAQSARLYGTINGKEDADITKTEFNLALDGNVLPMRYNQEIVTDFFKLTQEHDKESQGIDFQSFIFYDFMLRLYNNQKTSRKYYLDKSGFFSLLNSNLFPSSTFYQYSMIPMNNLTSQSYQMYTYLNISNFNNEEDYLLKFVQTQEKEYESNTNTNTNHLRFNLKKSKIKLKTRSKNTHIYNLPTPAKFSLNHTANKLFDLIDSDSNGWLNWLDFGAFFQVSYLFNRFDPERRGKVTSGNIYESFRKYSDFPRLNYVYRARSLRFNDIPQNIFMDLFSTLSVFRIDDIAHMYQRRQDKSLLYEVELKRMFTKTNLRFVPDGHLNHCLRNLDKNNLPRYDWECAFNKGLVDNLHYYESSSLYQTSKINGLNITNTVFNNPDVVNLDPALSGSV